MEIQHFTIPLQCQFCGLKTGTLTRSSEFGWTKENTATHDFVDIRCTPCEVAHGSFKDMTEEYRTKMSATPLDAEAFVVANPKRQDFDVALAVKVAVLDKNSATIITNPI